MTYREKIFNKLTEYWTDADWEGEGKESLLEEIQEWIELNDRVNDLDLAVLYFEQYKGWG